MSRLSFLPSVSVSPAPCRDRSAANEVCVCNGRCCTHQKHSVGIFASHRAPARLGVVVFHTPSTARVIPTARRQTIRPLKLHFKSLENYYTSITRRQIQTLQAIYSNDPVHQCCLRSTECKQRWLCWLRSGVLYKMLEDCNSGRRSCAQKVFVQLRKITVELLMSHGLFYQSPYYNPAEYASSGADTNTEYRVDASIITI